MTLAEITTAVGIIGMVIAIAMPNIQRAGLRAREAKLRQDLSVVRGALDRFYADTGVMPSHPNQLITPGGTGHSATSYQASSVVTPVAVPWNLWRGPYLRSLPTLEQPFVGFEAPLFDVNGFEYDIVRSLSHRHWFRLATSRTASDGTRYDTW